MAKYQCRFSLIGTKMYFFVSRSTLPTHRFSCPCRAAIGSWSPTTGPAAVRRRCDDSFLKKNV
ncbi:hypothetical protein FBU59_006504, partial [Linderina macrospora]